MVLERKTSRRFTLLKGIAFLFVVTAAGSVHAQNTSPQRGNPGYGRLQMPPVTPEQAERYLSTRAIPAVTTAVPVEKTEAGPPKKIDVEAVLGHELPEGDTTQYGFKRADFATASSSQANADKGRDATAGSSPTLGKRPATAVITQEPPGIAGSK